jgi:hypothetical protein
MRSTVTRVLVVGLLATSLAACGGSDSGSTTTTAGGGAATTSSAAPVTTTEAVAPTTTEGTNGGGGQSDGSTDGMSGVSAVCLEATQAMASAASAYGSGLAGAAGGTLDEQSLQQAADQIQAMAAAAPDEIKDDFQIIADGLTQFYSALADMGFQPGSVPTEEQLTQLNQIFDSIDQTAFETASNNIEAWFNDNCGG